MTTVLRLLAVLLFLTVLAGCGGEDENARSSDGGGSAAEPAPAALDPDAGPFAVRDTAAEDDAVGDAADGTARQEVPREAKLIHRGHVSLESDDVRKARLEAQSVATKYDGEVTASETASDGEGETTFAHLVLRVPAESFAQASADLEKIGTLRESTTDTDDATTQVADVDARVKVQRASIDRIRTLLSAAKDIGDVVRIESELSRREADLDSLLAQQAYLADQTSRSTITVDISRTGEGPAEDRDGFIGGLQRGWDGLVGFTSGALLVVGVLVPWLPLVALVAALAWWGVRRLRPRRPAREPLAG